jgi:dTDP-4-dehydrorhamnose reductase
MTKLLITGADSYLGQRLSLDLGTKYQIEGTYHSTPKDGLRQLDICKRDLVLKLVGYTMPDVIIHSAAIANRKLCDENPELANETNVDGTRNVAQAAALLNVPIIFVSSEAIFFDNVYGRSKRKAEEIVKNSRTPHAILRPGIILGWSPNEHGDRPYNRLLRDIQRGSAEYDGSLTQPTWAGHMSQVIDQIIQEQIYRVILPVAVSDNVSMYQLAHDVLSPFGVAVTELKGAGPSGKPMDLTPLREHGLLVCSYKELLENVVEETTMRRSLSVLPVR